MGQRSTWKKTCAVSVFVRLNAVWHQIAFSVEENYKAAFLSIFSSVFGQQLWSNAPGFGQNQKPQPENPGFPVACACAFKFSQFTDPRKTNPRSGGENSTRSRNQSDCRICWIPLMSWEKDKNWYKPFRVTQESNWIPESLGKWIAVDLEAGDLQIYFEL